MQEFSEILIRTLSRAQQKLLVAFAMTVVALIGGPLLAADPVPQLVPRYTDHLNLLYYLDVQGERHPVNTLADWQQRRGHILLGMQAVMGNLPKLAHKSPLDVQVIEEVSVGKILRRKLTYQSEPGVRVPAYLFLPPHTGNQKLAAVLCLHQTNPHGKSEAAGLKGNPEMQYAKELAERGFVTLAPDYPSFGDYQWNFTAHPEYASGTMKAIWDNIRGVDLLQSLPEVDGERIGCLGHSLGGHNTLFTGAFEPRLKAFVTCCGFSRFGRDDVPSWSGKSYMPRIAKVYGNSADKLPFDFPEVLATLAPRPLLVVAAKKDNDFDVQGVQETLTQVRPLYALFKQESRLQAIFPDAGHSFPQESRRVAYEFLATQLKAK